MKAPEVGNVVRTTIWPIGVRLGIPTGYIDMLLAVPQPDRRPPDSELLEPRVGTWRPTRVSWGHCGKEVVQLEF